MSDNNAAVVNALVKVLAGNNSPPAERASDGRMICRRFKQGLQCGFGPQCRFAHVDSAGRVHNTPGAPAAPGMPALPPPPPAPGAPAPAAAPTAVLDNGAILTFTNAATAPPPRQTLAEKARALVGEGANTVLIDYCGLKGSPKAVYFWACEAAWVVWRLSKRALTGEMPWRLGAVPGACHTEASELMRLVHPDATFPDQRLGDEVARGLVQEMIQMLEAKGIQPVECEN